MPAKKRWPQSLAGKFNMLVIFVILATSLGVSAYFVRQEKKHRYRDLVDHGRVLSGMMAENGQYGVYTRDPVSLKTLLKGIDTDPEIAYACFFDQRGMLILSRAKSSAVQPPDITLHGSSVSPGEIRYRENRNPGDGLVYIDFLAPVVSQAMADPEGMLFGEDAGPAIIGYFQLGLTQEQTARQVRQFLWSTGQVTALFVVLGVFLTVMVTRKITTPIRELVVFTRAVSDERLDMRTDARGSTEIVSLASSFNEMLQRLNVSRGELTRRTHELSETNERLSLLLGSMPVVVYAREAAGGYRATYVSGNVYDVTGYPADAFFTGSGFWTGNIHPEDRPRVDGSMSNLREKGFHEHEYRWKVSDGSYKWFRDSMRLVGAKDAEPGHIVGVWEDISLRKQDEKTRALLTMAVEQAAESILITDTEGTIQYVNPAFEQVSGHRREEVLGKNPRILRSGEHDETFYKDLWDTITGGRIWSGNLISRRKDGTLIHEVAVISPVRDEAGKTVNYVAVKRDVTNEMQLEEQLRQAQKMEAIGKLAGGIAHDFNNLLTAILGYCDILLLRLDPADRTRNEVEGIREAGDRAASLTRQLLAFSRKQMLELKVVDLNRTIENMDNMVRRLIGEDIVLETIPRNGLGKVRVDPGQIDQVIMNLVVNSRDAMPDGGKITIETANVSIDEEYARMHAGAKPGEYVMLAVSDTGCGMDEETQSRVFEPFFTTKGSGKGTGLGLSTVYGIVKQTGGNIWVYSEKGKGTTFKIYLPRTLDPEEEQEKRPGVSTVQYRGTETLLVAEDEEIVRDLICTSLREHGYKVLEAQNGMDALKVSNMHQGSIDMLLTDVVMPGMSGRELAERFVKKHPKGRVLFMSGYTENAVVQHGVLDPGTAFLQKPFRISTLKERVREVLERGLGV